MLRTLDVILAILGLLIAFPLMVLLSLIGFWDSGSPLFRQVRVGRDQKPFTLLKFRTMKLDTESVATHLADPAAVTRFGAFQRRTKLDELPQLWNVLKGEMSLVGPRPCLFEQEDLVKERASRGIFAVRPGITGFAQIQGIDMSKPQLLAETEAQMLRELNLTSYFTYIFKTLIGSGYGDRIRDDNS